MTDQYEELLANATMLIQNVSRDLELFAELNEQDNASTRQQNRSIRSSTPTLCPSPVYDLNYAEQVNMLCDDVDSNLRSAGISTSREDVAEIIDLSETANNSNDVVVVCANEPIIVDLCTPSRQTPRRRGRRQLRRNSRTATTSTANRCAPLNNEVEVISATTAPPDITVQKKHNVSAESDDLLKCAVCMESAYKNQPTSTKCGHVFCNACIKQVINLQRKCPMCNTKMTEKSLLRLYV